MAFFKKFGEKLILTSFSSMTLNSFLKLAIARPRPYTTGKVSRLELDAGPLFSTTDLAALESCPSGHSQMGAGMFFTAAFHFKKRWAWVVFPLATLGGMWSKKIPPGQAENLDNAGVGPNTLKTAWAARRIVQNANAFSLNELRQARFRLLRLRERLVSGGSEDMIVTELLKIAKRRP